MEFKAAERVRFAREMLSLTRQEFADRLGLDVVRLRNIEQLKVRVSELEYDAVAEHLPELVCFVTHEGNISAMRLRNSDNPRCRLIISRLEAGDLDDNKAKDWIK